jgi:hypothetical protein
MIFVLVFCKEVSMHVALKYANNPIIKQGEYAKRVKMS